MKCNQALIDTGKGYCIFLLGRGLLARCAVPTGDGQDTLVMVTTLGDRNGAMGESKCYRGKIRL